MMIDAKILIFYKMKKNEFEKNLLFIKKINFKSGLKIKIIIVLKN